MIHLLLPLDWLLFVIIVVGLGVRTFFGMRALKALTPDEARRRRPAFWARAILSQWALVAAVFALWFVARRDLAWLGLGMPRPWGLGGVAVGLAALGALFAAQRRQVGANPELLARLRAQLEPAQALMPHARAEYPGFASLAITAGLCEELLFRGYATWVLAHVFPAFWMAALAQAVLFGLAHAYQGPRGVVGTGFVGIFMSGIVWITGSLWAAMLIHALIDLHAGDMALRVFAQDAAGSGPHATRA